MPRPQLPAIVTHARAFRLRNLRILLGLVREKYPGAWQELVGAVCGCGQDVGAIRGVVEAWLRSRRLLDTASIARVAAIELLAAEPAVRQTSCGMIGLSALGGLVVRLLPTEETPRVADFLAKIAPAPVTVHYDFTIGITEKMTLADAALWMSAAELSETRTRILADFTEKLDAALAEYRRNCEAAGLAEEKVSGAERERLAWLARHLVEGRSIPALAREKNHEYEALRKALAKTARACGLHLTRGGSKPVK